MQSLMTSTRNFGDDDLATLSNICTTAADRYAEYARTLREPTDGSSSGPATERLAQQFDRQEGQAREFAALFLSAMPVAIEFVPETVAADG